MTRKINQSAYFDRVQARTILDAEGNQIQAVEGFDGNLDGDLVATGNVQGEVILAAAAGDSLQRIAVSEVLFCDAQKNVTTYSIPEGAYLVAVITTVIDDISTTGNSISVGPEDGAFPNNAYGSGSAEPNTQFLAQPREIQVAEAGIEVNFAANPSGPGNVRVTAVYEVAASGGI
jgi:hypothetical protein